MAYSILTQQHQAFIEADPVDKAIQEIIRQKGGILLEHKYFWMKYTRVLRTTLDIIDAAMADNDLLKHKGEMK